ncbi:MAG TPA: hypothetical protein VM754_09135 [Actinomycetota bacterium]|nr:hypothetical protein [Actinomycetota bacterium]
MSPIPVGTPKVSPDAPAHVPGVRQGNEPKSYDKEPGFLDNDLSDARRSTGVDAKRRNAISPDMPNLSPP